MSPTLTAALTVSSALALMLGGIAVAKTLVRPQVTTNVTVTRVNGQKVTQEVGTVRKWSLCDGRMTLEYVPDPVFQDGFDAPR